MLVLNDFSTSVKKSLSEIDNKWHTYEGLVICGTHTPFQTERMIDDIEEARLSGLPFYGECFGYQLACIEWARHVMGIKDATSEEFGVGTFVVKKRSELKVGLKEGESWWSYYEVIPEVVASFEAGKPYNFFVSPAHPAYQSSKDKPHPLLVKFIEYART